MSSFGEKRGSAASLYVISLLSGFALSLAFPKTGLFFLAWFVLIPFLWGLTNSSAPASFKAGLLFGFAFFFGTQYWIYHSINYYGHASFVLSIVIVFLLCLYESLYTALFGFLVNHIIKKFRLPLVMFAPALWVCLEYARGILLTGFPWSFIGHSQHSLLTLVQIADITGVYGISFMVVAVNSIIVDFMLLNKRRKSIPLYPAVPTYLSALLILFFIGGSLYYGYYRLHREPAGGRTKVAVVQGNIEQDKKWDPSYQAVVFSTYLSLTKEVSKRNPDLIVWPETSAPFFFGTDKEYTSLLVDFLRENKIPLVFGNVLIRSLTEGKYRLTNSLVVLNPDGNIIYTYDKIHLVPFGEYVPLRSLLFFVDKIVVGVGDFIPGTDQKLAAVPSGQFAPAICYELAFPSQIRSFFAKGGDFLVTITNDAWFGRTSGPYQHFYMGVFRAIENRKPVIRAANTGISGFIDSYGRVLQKSDLFKQQTLVSVIEKNSKITFYTKYGDLFIYFCLLTVAIIMVNAMFHTKQQHFGGKRW